MESTNAKLQNMVINEQHQVKFIENEADSYLEKLNTNEKQLNRLRKVKREALEVVFQFIYCPSPHFITKESFSFVV